MQTLRRIAPSTQRQRIAHCHGVSTETIRRWTRFIEQCSLDWVRVSPNGKTPRRLHPYQSALLDWVVTHSSLGQEWIEPMLLHDDRFTFTHWKQCQQFPTFGD